MVIVFDLDDTLYDEVDFVKSGFKEISCYLGNEKFFDFMWKEFEQNGSGKIFNKLIEYFNLDVSLEKLIEIYRFHKPKITLSKNTINFLNFCKNFHTALITDGHYIMQKNKFEALGLKDFIEYPIFTDFYNTKKPEKKPFLMVMERFKEDKKFIYIADNPNKDFLAIKDLGWIGIRFRNPKGIYRHLKNNTDFEVDKIEKIIPIIKRLINE